MNDPHGLKRPGRIAVAPRNAAAKAGSRSVCHEDVSADPEVPTYTTPPTAAMNPEDIIAPIRTRPTLTPLRRATLRPRPVKSSRRPTGVNWKTYQTTTQTASP